MIGKCCSVWVWGCLVLGAIISWPLPWCVILRDLPWVETELGQLPACYSFQAVQRFEGSPTIHCLAPRLALALCASGPPKTCKVTTHIDMRMGTNKLATRSGPLGQTQSGTQAVRLQVTHTGWMTLLRSPLGRSHSRYSVSEDSY